MVSGGRRAHLLRQTFDLGAPLYGWVTAQHTWRANAARLTTAFPSHGAPRVLDLGTGPGVSIVGMHAHRPDARYVGLDLAGGMLGQAARRLAGAGITAPLLRADAAHLPFPDATFDVITGHSFLYLLPEPVMVLRECARLLVPGGRAAFVEPAAGWGDWGTLLRRHGREGRYLTSMVGWTIVARLEGPYTPTRFEAEAAAAALHAEQAEPLLHGLGWLLTATRSPR